MQCHIYKYVLVFKSKTNNCAPFGFSNDFLHSWNSYFLCVKAKVLAGNHYYFLSSYQSQLKKMINM